MPSTSCCADATQHRWTTTDERDSPFADRWSLLQIALTPGSDYQWNNEFGNDRVKPDFSGERIPIVGKVFDAHGEAIPDSMLEIWQADAQGLLGDPRDARAVPNTAFKGFGRCGTDINGGFFHDALNSVRNAG
jgi:protocatechuate 3,4-dioxygenase beta subunit